MGRGGSTYSSPRPNHSLLHSLREASPLSYVTGGCDRQSLPPLPICRIDDPRIYYQGGQGGASKKRVEVSLYSRMLPVKVAINEAPRSPRCVRPSIGPSASSYVARASPLLCSVIVISAFRTVRHTRLTRKTTRLGVFMLIVKRVCRRAGSAGHPSRKMPHFVHPNCLTCSFAALIADRAWGDWQFQVFTAPSPAFASNMFHVTVVINTHT